MAVAYRGRGGILEQRRRIGSEEGTKGAMAVIYIDRQETVAAYRGP